MTLREKDGEHIIKILQNGREVIRATGDEREQAFQMAARDLVRRFETPAEVRKKPGMRINLYHEN